MVSQTFAGVKSCYSSHASQTLALGKNLPAESACFDQRPTKLHSKPPVLTSPTAVEIKSTKVQNPRRILPYLAYYVNACARKLGTRTYA